MHLINYLSIVILFASPCSQRDISSELEMDNILASDTILNIVLKFFNIFFILKL